MTSPDQWDCRILIVRRNKRINYVLIVLFLFVSFTSFAGEKVIDYACDDAHTSKNADCIKCFGGGKGAYIFSAKIFEKSPSDTKVSDESTLLMDTVISKEMEEAAIAIHESSTCEPCGDRYRILQNDKLVEVRAAEFCKFVTDYNANCDGCLHVYILYLD